MKKSAALLLALALVMSVVAGVAHAKFSPKFTVELSDTKVKGNPALTFHMEFAEDDEEIGMFTGFIPKGFNIASDEDIPEKTDTFGREVGEEIGSGEIQIAAGPACRSGPESAIPLKPTITVPATFYERSRTDDEEHQGVHAVWFLDIEPANRVRLLVTGSVQKGWTVTGAPTPSDNTCNPLVVDLTIDAQSESGVPIVTNPAKAGKKVFKAQIDSQDSPAVAKFKQAITITK